jgi:hypothetical protein
VVERGVGLLSERLGEELTGELLEGEVASALERTLEKTVERGADVLHQTEGLRQSLKQAPQELISQVGQRVDRYRAEGVEVARAELRRFLDRVDLNKELQKLLSQFSVEVTTEIRFAPAEDGVGVKPMVKTSAQVKRCAPPEPVPSQPEPSAQGSQGSQNSTNASTSASTNASTSASTSASKTGETPST